MTTAIQEKSSFPVGKLAVGGTLAIIILGAIVLTTSYFGWANTGVDYERDIRKMVSANEIEYNRFTRTVVESLGVANQYKKGLTEVIEAGLQGRYADKGAGGSLATAIKEAYPTIPQDMFLTVQRQIEAGRMNFADEQRRLVDAVENYKGATQRPWSGMWLRYAGYPTINFDEPKYNPIVSSQTKESFTTGEDSFELPKN